MRSSHNSTLCISNEAEQIDWDPDFEIVCGLLYPMIMAYCRNLLWCLIDSIESFADQAVSIVIPTSSVEAHHGATSQVSDMRPASFECRICGWISFSAITLLSHQRLQRPCHTTWTVAVYVLWDHSKLDEDVCVSIVLGDIIFLRHSLPGMVDWTGAIGDTLFTGLNWPPCRK